MARATAEPAPAALPSMPPAPDTFRDETGDGTAEGEEYDIVTLTPEEARALLDAEARYYLGLSGEEFTRRWKTGYWPDPDAEPWVIPLSFLLVD